MGQFHFDPDTYLELIHEDVPAYDELQRRIADALAGLEVASVLDLGAGTGETSRRVRERHPEARIVAVDENEGMLARIRPPDVETVRQRLQDPLPAGPFDAVVSALAVHHLDPEEKRALFAAVRAVLRPGGLFVLGDVVLATTVVAPLTDGYDKPDRAADQLDWLRAAGLETHIVWERDDLALLVAVRP